MNPFGFFNAINSNILNIQKDCIENAFNAAFGILTQAEAVNNNYLIKEPWISPDGKKMLSAWLILQSIQLSYLKALHEESHGVLSLVFDSES